MIKSITQLLSRLLLLLCVGWGSVASLHAQMQHAVSDLVSGTYYRIKNANTRSEAQAKGYLADESGMVKAQAFKFDRCRCATVARYGRNGQEWLLHHSEQAYAKVLARPGGHR